MPSLTPPNTRFTRPELSAERLFDEGLAAIERHAVLAESAADFRRALMSGPDRPPGPRAAPPQITRLPAPPSRRGKSSKRAFLAPDAVREHIRGMLPGPDGLVALLGLGAVTSRTGTRLTMRCPSHLTGHADSTPSFGIGAKGGAVVFGCFGCGVSGDVFGLIALAKGFDPKTQFPKVLDAAARLVGYGSAADVRRALEIGGVL